MFLQVLYLPHELFAIYGMIICYITVAKRPMTEQVKNKSMGDSSYGRNFDQTRRTKSNTTPRKRILK
jgi:hypothetical protein